MINSNNCLYSLQNAKIPQSGTERGILTKEFNFMTQGLYIS